MKKSLVLCLIVLFFSACTPTLFEFNIKQYEAGKKINEWDYYNYFAPDKDNYWCSFSIEDTTFLLKSNDILVSMKVIDNDSIRNVFKNYVNGLPSYSIYTGMRKYIGMSK